MTEWCNFMAGLVEASVSFSSFAHVFVDVLMFSRYTLLVFMSSRLCPTRSFSA
jgi:hypothetical protein